MIGYPHTLIFLRFGYSPYTLTSYTTSRLLLGSLVIRSYRFDQVTKLLTWCYTHKSLLILFIFLKL